MAHSVSEEHAQPSGSGPPEKEVEKHADAPGANGGADGATMSSSHRPANDAPVAGGGLHLSHVPAHSAYALHGQPAGLPVVLPHGVDGGREGGGASGGNMGGGIWGEQSGTGIAHTPAAEPSGS